MSRLDDLRALASALNDEPSQTAARIELGCYLARAGELDEARGIAEALRTRREPGSDLHSSVLAFLLDGLCAYFACDTNGALDRLRRGFELSRSFGLTPLSMRFAAWLLHVRFNAFRIDGCRDDLAYLAAHWKNAPQDAVIRAQLTLADMEMTAGHLAQATARYAVTRRLAETIGDRLVLGAIMHNRSTQLLSNFRWQEFVERSAWRGDRFRLQELSSAESFESLVGALGGLYPYALSRARLLLLDGEYERALRAYEPCLDGLARGDRRLLASARADMALCHHCLQRPDPALTLVAQVLDDGFEAAHSDDHAVALAISATILTDLGQAQRAVGILETVSTLRAANHRQMELLQSMLSSYRDVLTA